MGTISELFQLDISSIIMGSFVIMASMIAAYEIIGKVSFIIGKPVQWVKIKNSDHELILQTKEGLKDLQEKHQESVKQSIRHDEMIKKDISSLSEAINRIANTLDEMQEKENETKLKELQDSLIRYYNKYKTIGSWSNLEKDAFWDLFEDYEKRGGDGYIHSIVEPAMRELKVID